MIMKDADLFHEKFVHLKMESIWGQHCENMKDKLLEDIEANLIMLE
mgnify:CR=1 FL=1